MLEMFQENPCKICCVIFHGKKVFTLLIGAGSGGGGVMGARAPCCIFRKCLFSLRKKLPSSCRARRLEMLPTVLTCLLQHVAYEISHTFQNILDNESFHECNQTGYYREEENFNLRKCTLLLLKSSFFRFSVIVGLYFFEIPCAVLSVSEIKISKLINKDTKVLLINSFNFCVEVWHSGTTSCIFLPEFEISEIFQ